MKRFTINKNIILVIFLVLGLLFSASCKKKEVENLKLVQITAGTMALNLSSITRDILVNSPFIVDFSTEIDTLPGSQGISLRKNDNSLIQCNLTFLNNNKSVH